MRWCEVEDSMLVSYERTQRRKVDGVNHQGRPIAEESGNPWKNSSY